MRTQWFQLAAAVLLSGASAVGGSFNSDFSNPNQSGFTLTSNYADRPEGGTYEPVIEDGHLILTYAENSQQGAIVLDDLDGGQPIDSFTATFKLQIGPGSGNAADGFAFCFGSDINSTSNFSEEGTGNGLIVAFDIYDNGGGEAPAIEVKYGGASLAIAKFAKADMVTSEFEAVSIQVTRSGTLSLSYKGQALFSNLVIPAYEPVAGQFAFGARTGGENAAMWLDDLNVTTTVAGDAVRPTITADPQSQSIEEGADATFTVGFDGSAPLTFAWYKNSTLIAEATGSTLTLSSVSFTDNQAKIKCEVSNAGGTATSQDATLTVVQDATPPTLVSGKGSTDFLGVVLTFSEPVAEASGGSAANYTIAGLTVNSATVLGSQVVLATGKQAEGATYTVVVNNVKDRSVAGNTIAANSQVEIKTFAFMLGTMLHKKYDNVDDGTGANPENLFNDPRFPNQPDRVDLASMWEYPADGAGRVPADPVRNYFDTLEGFFIPPTTGNYVFYIAGADRFWLYLSTDEDPANKHLVAAEPGGWSDARGWMQIHSGSLESRRTDQYLDTQWPDGNTISLTAGRRYYMLQVHHDPSWCGGDFYGATYKMESEEDPVSATAPRLTGSVVGTYVDPSGSAIDITQQPVDTTQEQGRSAVFTIAATGTSAYGVATTYQWQRQPPSGGTWTDIAEATGPSYTTPVLTLAESGAKYRVVCTVPAVVVNSTAATLTVVSDSAPPKLVGAGAVPSQTGTTFDVGVSFDEAVTAATAGNVANYTLSAGSLTGIKVYDGSPGVVLTASGLAVGGTYTVTVANVKDTTGNTMTSTAKEFKVSGMKWGVVGGNEAGLGNGVLAVEENGFDVYSDGIGEWGSYDEATFVYEEVTGDFDKVVRVEFQDASSQWARAGLIAREVTNFGVDRTTQEAGEAGRYQKVHVNPVTTAMGTTGDNKWEGNRRLLTGGVTDTAGNGGIPLYPNAWCRLQRVGDLFTVYRSDDGVIWTQLGTTTFTEPMPAKLFVGPEYSPENGNIPADSGLRGVWVAKFRDYGTYNPVTTPTVSISAAGIITYTGVLQSSATVNGTYAPVAGAVSPYTAPKTGAAMFYRAASQ
ncbi:MAG: immunoglobulin domain-containing protein [Limisphaerales bacterium]